MSNWITEYSSALSARDVREKANISLTDAYTKLADRTAAAERTSSAAPPSPAPGSPQPGNTKSPRSTTPLRGKNTPDTDPSELLSRMRSDLANTQKSRAELQSQLTTATTSLSNLQLQSLKDNKRVDELTRDKAILERRVKDRDEEIKGKARLVEEVQDEMVSLNLQLNMAEKKVKRFEAENKELVDRWMARMGKEADQMNEESKWS